MGHWYNQQFNIRAENSVHLSDGTVLSSQNKELSPINNWIWYEEPPYWYPVKKIYTETPFDIWISASGIESPVIPKEEGWIFPIDEGWEDELSARNMEWEYIEVTRDPDGVWTTVKAKAGGLWESIKSWFS